MGRGKHQAWPDSPMDGTIPNRSSAQTVTSLTAVAVRICRMVLIMKKFVFKRAVLFYCRAVRQSLSKGISVGGRARAKSLDASQGFSLAFTAGICTSVLKIQKFICLINSRKKKIFEKNLTFLS